MKKGILLVFVIGAMLSACTNSGKKAETKDAVKVEQKAGESATMFKTVSADSKLNWRASHLGGVQPRYGTVGLKNATLTVGDNKLVNASIVVDLASLSVDNFEDEDSKNKLTGHLLSPDFFNVASHPNAKFDMSSINYTSGDYNSKVTGNLTILDVTKSISFNANVNVSGTGVNVKSEDFSVDRKDWGLTYNTEGTVGVPKDYLIADDIGFTIDISVGK